MLEQYAQMTREELEQELANLDCERIWAVEDSRWHDALQAAYYADLVVMEMDRRGTYGVQS